MKHFAIFLSCGCWRKHATKRQYTGLTPGQRVCEALGSHKIRLYLCVCVCVCVCVGHRYYMYGSESARTTTYPTSTNPGTASAGPTAYGSHAGPGYGLCARGYGLAASTGQGPLVGPPHVPLSAQVFRLGGRDGDGDLPGPQGHANVSTPQVRHACMFALQNTPT